MYSNSIDCYAEPPFACEQHPVNPKPLYNPHNDIMELSWKSQAAQARGDEEAELAYISHSHYLRERYEKRYWDAEEAWLDSLPKKRQRK